MGKRIFAAILLLLFIGPLTDIASSRTDRGALEGEHYAISLRVLSQRISSASFLERELANLCSISRFEGFVLDPDMSDIILIGQRSSRDRLLHLDDLVVHMRNIWSENGPPICSLDPRAEDILAVREIPSELGNINTLQDGQRIIKRVKEVWGPQMISIGGIPRNSRLAHAMIEADYHMKKVSLDVINVAGINSYLDMRVSEDKSRILAGEDTVSRGISFNRFWFHVEDGFPTFFEEEGIIWLDECPIILLTEKQSIAASGELEDDTEDDPVAIAFSEEFSKRFEQASEQVPSYAELYNLYVLKALLEAMYYLDSPLDAGFDMDYYLNNYKYRMETQMPDSMPGCVNYKQASFENQEESQSYWEMPTSFGGVYMEMEITEEQFEGKKELRWVKSEVIRSRPSPDTLSWVFIIR